MNNINSNNYPEKSNKYSRWNKLPYTLLLVSLLSLNNPAEAKTINTYNFNQQDVEVLVDSSIVSNIERKTWIILPKMYADKIKNFVQNSKVVEGLGARFTENFIVDQMKSDRWISKQNQLLFIWDAVYEQITKKNFYDWEDWDEKRLEEFENAMDSIEICGEKYKEWFTSYMKQKSAEARQQSTEARQQSTEARQQSTEARQQSAEARQQSAEARQQSAEARQQSAEARQQSAEAVKEIMKQDSTRVKERMSEFYDLYIQNPNNIKQDDLNFMKKSTKEFIADCKKHWIDYRAILLKEVWDKRKVDAILKFYGVE